MNYDIEEVVYSENVLGFVKLADDYCALLDKVKIISQYQFIDHCHKLLPLIYLKAIILPETEPIDPDMIEKEVTREEWEAIYDNLQKKLKSFDTYTEVFDPLITQGAEQQSLSEHFADIYQDLRDFTALYHMGNAELMNDALWEVKKNFKEYWGQRLVNTLRILHHLLYSGQKLDKHDAKTQDHFDPEKRAKRDMDN